MAAAKAYGERKGISYAAWREVGVPDCGAARPAGIIPLVLSRGLPRGRRTARTSGRGVEQRVQQRDARRQLPSSSAEARSGWGISPTTLRPGEQTPAMSSIDPLGLSV